MSGPHHLMQLNGVNRGRGDSNSRYFSLKAGSNSFGCPGSPLARELQKSLVRGVQHASCLPGDSKCCAGDQGTTAADTLRLWSAKLAVDAPGCPPLLTAPLGEFLDSPEQSSKYVNASDLLRTTLLQNICQSLDLALFVGVVQYAVHNAACSCSDPEFSWHELSFASRGAYDCVVQNVTRIGTAWFDDDECNGDHYRFASVHDVHERKYAPVMYRENDVLVVGSNQPSTPHVVHYHYQTVWIMLPRQFERDFLRDCKMASRGIETRLNCSSTFLSRLDLLTFDFGERLIDDLRTPLGLLVRKFLEHGRHRNCLHRSPSRTEAFKLAWDQQSADLCYEVYRFEIFCDGAPDGSKQIQLLPRILRLLDSIGPDCSISQNEIREWIVNRTLLHVEQNVAVRLVDLMNVVRVAARVSAVSQQNLFNDSIIPWITVQQAREGPTSHPAALDEGPRFLDCIVSAHGEGLIGLSEARSHFRRILTGYLETTFCRCRTTESVRLPRPKVFNAIIWQAASLGMYEDTDGVIATLMRLAMEYRLPLVHLFADFLFPLAILFVRSPPPLPTHEAGQNAANSFLRWIVAIFARRLVGDRPMRPQDHKCRPLGCGCRHCDTLDRFLVDPERRKFCVFTKDEEQVRHLGSRIKPVEPAPSRIRDGCPRYLRALEGRPRSLFELFDTDTDGEGPCICLRDEEEEDEEEKEPPGTRMRFARRREHRVKITRIPMGVYVGSENSDHRVHHRALDLADCVPRHAGDSDYNSDDDNDSDDYEDDDDDENNAADDNDMVDDTDDNEFLVHSCAACERTYGSSSSSSSSSSPSPSSSSTSSTSTSSSPSSSHPRLADTWILEVTKQTHLHDEELARWQLDGERGRMLINCVFDWDGPETASGRKLHVVNAYRTILADAHLLDAEIARAKMFVVRSGQRREMNR